MTDSEWWYLDLTLTIAYAGGVTVALLSGLGGILRVVVTIPLVILVPGYAVISIWYPDVAGPPRPFDEEKTGLTNPVPTHRGLTPLERLCGAVVCTLLLVPPITLAASLTEWGIAPTPIVIGLAGVTIISGILAMISRWRTPPEDRFDLTQIAGIMIPPNVGTRTRPVTAFNVALLLSLILLTASIGYAIANPPSGEGYTEFYLDTEPVTGETETMYEARLTENTPTEFTVHIRNAEHRNVEYTLVTVMEVVEYENDSADVQDGTELDRRSVHVANGDHHEESVEVVPPIPGENLRILFLLYAGDAPDNPTEETATQMLRLPVTVT